MYVSVHHHIGQIVTFLISVARDWLQLSCGKVSRLSISVMRDWLRFELELRDDDNRVCFSVASYDIAIVFSNFDFELLELFTE